MSSLPLAGRRVLVTRAAHQAGKLSEGLRALGAEPVEVPVLEIRPPESFDPLDAGSAAARSLRLADPDQREHCAGACGAGGRVGHSTWSRTASLKVAAIGDATAAAARKAGFAVTLVPESYVAESLLKGLTGLVAGRRVLLARAAVARDVIPDALRRAGAMVDVVDAYRNVMPEDAPERLRSALAAGIDAATFTSSSSATHLAEAARAAGIKFPFAGVAAVSIGPITSQTLRELGWEPAAEAVACRIFRV